MSRHGRAAFAFIFVTVALDMLALGVVIPVLPRLLIELKGGDVAGAAVVSGVFGFAWAAMQFLFSPLMGALSDRFGRRPVILLSNLGLGLDGVLMALAPTLPWLFAGRLISGITSSSYPCAGAYVADVTPPEERAARFGMLGAAFGLGFVVGPALGGLLGGVSPRLPFWVSAALSLVNAAYGFFILPESLPAGRRKPFDWRAAHPFGSLAFLRSNPGLLGLAAAAFLFYAAHESLPSTFVLYTGFRYGWSAPREGFVLGLLGTLSAAVSALLVGPAVERLGERAVLGVGLVCGGLGFTVYALSKTGAGFLAGVPLIALWSLATPALQTLLSRQVAPEEQGRLQGALAGLRGVTGMVGPLVFTQVFAAAMATRLPGAPYLVALGLLAASLGLSRQAD